MQQENIGVKLLEARLITTESFQRAQLHVQTVGGSITAALIKLEVISDHDLTKFLSELYGVPLIDLSAFTPDPEVVKLLPGDVAYKFQVVPISLTGGRLTVAMANPSNIFALDDIKFITGCEVWPCVATEMAIKKAIDKAYDSAASYESVMKCLDVEIEDVSRHRFEGASATEEPLSGPGAAARIPLESEPTALSGPWQYRVWFATNRGLEGTPWTKPRLANKIDSRGRVHYGHCVISIPRTHMFGSIGTPWWNRLLKGRLEDDHLKLVRCRLMGKADAFLGELRSELGSLSAGQRHLLVYLHGYNVSFEDAALRAAQIGFDLKVQGATAFFSWPSCASAPSYGADLARIEASEQDIADFLAGLASDSAADVIHVVAHSMGNRGLARAVQRITAAAADTSRIRFGQIILAAPDLDVALFKDLARIYPAISARTTMYCCPRDRVLQLSRWMQDSNRAGFTPPVTVVDGIDTVEVTNIDLTLLGHGYHAEAESILRDMKELIDHNAPPVRRARLRESRTAQGQPYWSIA